MAAARLLLRPSFFFFIFLLFSPMTYSMTDPEALLQLKKSLTKADALNSWVPGSSPCGGEVLWIGVICQNGIVMGIHLGGMHLSGRIEVDALLEMRGLRSISLANNTFSGPIPEFNQIGALKAIYLSGNQFSGEIPPDYFAKMDSLKKVFLSDNKFTGKIPPSLAQLPNLIELRLENNQFGGNIPSLDQPTLISMDVSNNNLSGEIPATLSKFNASSFAGNAGLCGKNFAPCQKEVGPTIESNNAAIQPHANKKNHSAGIIAAIIIALLALLSIVAVVIVRLRPKPEDLDVLEHEKQNAGEPVEVQVSHSGPHKKEPYVLRKGSNSSSRRSSNHSKSGGTADLVILNNEKGAFGLSDLMKASAEVLANGALASSYKAVMSNGLAVVVKRMKEVNALGRDAFDAEMRRLGKLKHSNILTPLAYHYRKDEKLVVCEYIPNGSLLYLLHGDHGPPNAELDWPARLKIVKGIAKGMDYLHRQFASSSVPHGNLKSSNVFLGPDYDPLISDYGMNPMINHASAASALFAYKAPEAVQTGQVSPKCDVYCLGIVILEILTGKYPSQYLNSNNGGIDLVQWVASAIADGTESELLDPEIASLQESVGEMERLLHIGAACTERHPEQRLDMKEAIRRIKEVQVEGVHEVARTIQVLPSLRDGYADSVPRANQSRGSQESLVVHSARRHGSESFRSLSGRHVDDSFAFAIS